MSGVKEALLRGEWCHSAPRGYDVIYESGRMKKEDRRGRGSKARKLVLNAEGKLIRKAFLWKVNEALSNEECRTRLANLGMKVTFQRMSQIFKNPFYCGLIAHNMLEGQLVEGNHEKAVSKEIFLKVNQIQLKNPHGYKQVNEQDNVPMRLFLVCDHCQERMTGYVVKKKNIWYYKCSTIGCGNNKSAKNVHSAFTSLLSSFSLRSEYQPLIKECYLN